MLHKALLGGWSHLILFEVPYLAAQPAPLAVNEWIFQRMNGLFACTFLDLESWMEVLFLLVSNLLHWCKGIVLSPCKISLKYYCKMVGSAKILNINLWHWHHYRSGQAFLPWLSDVSLILSRPFSWVPEHAAAPPHIHYSPRFNFDLSKDHETFHNSG